jgi:hypothetical protein
MALEFCSTKCKDHKKEGQLLLYQAQFFLDIYYGKNKVLFCENYETLCPLAKYALLLKQHFPQHSIYDCVKILFPIYIDDVFDEFLKSSPYFYELKKKKKTQIKKKSCNFCTKKVSGSNFARHLKLMHFINQ